MSDLTFLIDVQERLNSIRTSLFLFQIFVGIVGTIALIIAFFLLLISVTANIRENVWEYGVLRSMGLTKKLGVRVFLYEALAVVISSLFLGSVVGIAIAFTLAAQFYQFLELPLELSFPYALFFIMIIMALATTVIGVIVPVGDVNDRKISSVLKGLNL